MEDGVTIKNIMPDTAHGTGGDMLGGGGVIGGLLLGTLLRGGIGGLGGLGGYGGYGAYGNGGLIANAATGAVADSVVLNPAFNSLQQQISNLSNTLNTGDLQDSIHNVSDEILQTTANLQTAIATGNFTTLSSINGLGRDIVAQANQNALQQLNSFNNLTTTTLQGFNGQAMQMQNATNQIIAQGTANASAMASCCCEIKEAINRDGDATRALINDNRMADLQNSLNEARLAASQTAQTSALIAALGNNGNGNGNR